MGDAVVGRYSRSGSHCRHAKWEDAAVYGIRGGGASCRPLCTSRQWAEVQGKDIATRLGLLRDHISRSEASKAGSDPSSSAAGGGDASKGGHLSWPKAFQPQLQLALAQEPYTSLSSEVLASLEKREALSLLLRGSSAHQPLRRPSAVLLGMFWDKKKEPSVINPALAPVRELRAVLPDAFWVSWR